MVGENIDPAAVKRIAADAIRAADEDKDGQLNMAEFEKRLEGTDIDNLLKVSVPWFKRKRKRKNFRIREIREIISRKMKKIKTGKQVKENTELENR